MEGYEGTIIYDLVYDTEMPYIVYEEDDEFEEYRINRVIKYDKIRFLPDNWRFPILMKSYDIINNKYSYLPGLLPLSLIHISEPTRQVR
jgi:hypothetical protein